MTDVAEEPSLEARMSDLNALLEQVEKITDPAAREITTQVLQTMMDFHGSAIAKLLEQIETAGPLGKSLLKDLATDDLISSLLLLYNLHPLDLEARINITLKKLRPDLAGKGAALELEKLTEDNALHLKFTGKSHGCHSTAASVKHAIEQSFYDKAPELTAIYITGLEEPESKDGFVSVEQLISTTRAHTKGATHVQA